MLSSLEEQKRKKVVTALVLNPDKIVMLGTAYTLDKLPDAETSVVKEHEVRITCEAGANSNSPLSAPSPLE
ncbi:hypothetical protein P3T76_003942 [Phytophthora citrophthora]|uniref:Uncharacterized protein n=1 Tax=Phytophthora citrophthora TaxID=4793 RepID=A0AAD9LNV8_9STRA|nr:hypothetical protein P3T76_003942 [Phytophthora citrophthora]